MRVGGRRRQESSYARSSAWHPQQTSNFAPPWPSKLTSTGALCTADCQKLMNLYRGLRCVNLGVRADLIRVASSTDLKLRTALALEADQHRCVRELSHTARSYRKMRCLARVDGFVPRTRACQLKVPSGFDPRGVLNRPQTSHRPGPRGRPAPVH